MRLQAIKEREDRNKPMEVPKVIIHNPIVHKIAARVMQDVVKKSDARPGAES
jgi:hypothetical protein